MSSTRISILIGIVIALMLGAAFAGQSVPDPPPTPTDVIETGQSAWSAFTAGQWVLGLGFALTFVIQLFRAPWLGGIFARIPARWRVFIPVALSGIASALLSLAGEVEPALAVVLAPAMAGVAIGTHELGEAVVRRRPRYRKDISSVLSIVLGILLIGGCAIRPPAQAPQVSRDRQVDRSTSTELASTDFLTADSAWCRTRQERRWWSSAIAQGAGVLAGGLAASALARDDDRIELGLEVGSMVSAGIAAGAQTYSGAQASAYERYCGARP